MVEPSGDHVGLMSSDVESVKRVSIPVAVSNRYRFQSPSRFDWYAIRLFGPQTGFTSTACTFSVMRWGDEPSARARYTSQFPSRLLLKVIQSPLGERLGATLSKFASTPLVIATFTIG